MAQTAIVEMDQKQCNEEIKAIGRALQTCPAFCL